MKFLSALAWKN